MRITLDETEPPIWREIEIPASFSFYQLHIAIQDAMGWENEHLYKFTIKDPIKKVNVEIPPPPISGLAGKYDPDTEKLAQYINPGNKVFAYEYDFGDCWVHIITMK
ncbi:MAG: plasmid pRiA4b ORF-3 family protein [Firmicutes bacterium]|nr:plasmid pRiA4b ORF-3 family protein [Bacillota bacterium]